ncbi:MAG: DUF2934 domain-containing protein [Candidatus Lokiarchaeota archaeon]|nr:DUF2934 domain-containing protein [Candidatus Lokiarchaeota archaeon]MBD3200415.1 DUF2934 domain-containing protein [Candidatus Lokiarchaeota archaeon]
MNNNTEISEEEISVAAYYIWEKQHPYEILCWYLAERELYIKKGFQKPTKKMTRQRAGQIFSEHPPYDVLCWIIGKYNVVISQNLPNQHEISSLSE